MSKGDISDCLRNRERIKDMKDYITIIGGGLAGTEAAYQIAKKE